MKTSRTDNPANSAGEPVPWSPAGGHGVAVPWHALLATDGSTASAGAVAFAAALVRLRGATVRAVTVLDSSAYPYPYPGAGFEPSAADTEVLADGLDGRRAHETVLRQLSELIGDEVAATATFPCGRTVPTIVREAEESGASMIVLGLNRHDLIDRLAGEETALRVARTAPIPVLAVAPALGHLPSRIVVAVDFSPASVRAAQQVYSLAGDGARIVLAHVQPPVSERDHNDENAHYALGVGGALARLAATMPSTAAVTTETVALEGDPVEQLHQLAAKTDCELIALGSHRHSFVGRLMLGSVTTELIRAAEFSVFIAPPSERQPA